MELKASGRIEILHLLRGLAALSVCLFHFGGFNVSGNSLLPEGNWLRQITSHGYLGVHVFFILSGFLVPYSANRNGYTYSKWFSFLKRRVLRIEPPYIVSVLIMFVGYYIVFRFKHWPFPWTLMDLFYNLTYLVEWVNGSWFNVTYWTLAIEFQFYIVLIVTLPLFYHNRKSVRLLTLLATGLVSFFLDDKSFLVGHWSLFMIGLITAQYYVAIWSKVEYLLLLLASFILLYFQYFQFDASVLVVAALTIAFFHGFQNMLPIRGFLGNISYSLYITHCIFLAFVYGMGLELWTSWVGNVYWGYALFVIGILLSIGFADLFYRLIERPAQNLSRKMK